MAKEKVTLTLDSMRLRELRDLVGSRSLSAAVDDAVAAHVARLRHLSAVDDWLAELERTHGPIPPETLEWAAQIVERWETSTTPPSRTARAG
ncbi:MAG: CopG family transcriptional regulator [Longimicrobiales bacterium]